MGFYLRFSLVLLFFIFAQAKLQEPKKNKQLDLLWEFEQSRHKRNSIPAGTTMQPHIAVHHYHYYYYCCPDLASRVKVDPWLAQAIYNASCGCDQSSCFCQVPSSQQQQQQQHQQQQQQQQQQHQQHQHQQHQHQQHPYQQQQHQQHQHQQQQHQQHQHQQQQQQQQQDQKPNTQAKTQQTAQTSEQPHRQDLFRFSRMFNDPIGKEFFDFVTNNFVRRDHERELDQCFTSAFDDPICHDFFNFFTQNFMRKPDKHGALPNNLYTQPPSLTTQPVKTQQPNMEQPHLRDLRDFQKVDSMFNELENNMKKTFSKTADLGKLLGIKFNDFR